MKFFLDENFPKSVIPFLHERNHETFIPHILGLADKDIFLEAQQTNSVLLTTDKDFFHTIPFMYPKHYGIIVVALSLPNRNAIAEKLKWALENLEIGNLENRVILLRDKSYTIR